MKARLAWIPDKYGFYVLDGHVCIKCGRASLRGDVFVLDCTLYARGCNPIGFSVDFTSREVNTILVAAESRLTGNFDAIAQAFKRLEQPALLEEFRCLRP